MDDGEVVERYVELGALMPLTTQTFETERDGLIEDLLNWDHGHPMIPLYEETQVGQQKYL